MVLNYDEKGASPFRQEEASPVPGRMVTPIAEANSEVAQRRWGTVDRLPWTVYRSPWTVDRLPFTVDRLW
jgi:hypothetical protein